MYKASLSLVTLPWHGEVTLVSRYRKMILNAWGTNHLHRRNPWVGVWWSVALPGLGHFYLGAYLKGLVLMTWEIVLNELSHLNIAIYYSLLGHTELAKEVLVVKWALLYPAIYVLSFWDSYRLAVEINWLTELEEQQSPRHFTYQSLGTLGHTALVKRSPWVAVFWSMFVFGAGHLYNAELLKGMILMGWQVAVMALAGFTSSVFYTLLGEPHVAANVVSYQWLLFWPSMYLFSIYDAYQDCVELNKLAEEAQLDWLQRQRGEDNGMKTVVGVLVTTGDLERAVLALKGRGFATDSIRWGQLQRHGKSREPHGLRDWLAFGGALGDSFRRADGVSFMDGVTAGATVAALLGIVYGSVLPVGPVGGGTLGILIGGFIGWICDRWVRQRHTRKVEKAKLRKLGCIVNVACTGLKRVRAAKAALKDADAVLISVLE